MSTITKDQSQQSNTTQKSHVREGVAELKRDAQTIKEDLEVLKEDATELGIHATKHGIDAAKAGVQSSAEFAKGACDSVKGYQESMNKQIRSHPTASVLVALGAGLMVGRVLGSLRR